MRLFFFSVGRICRFKFGDVPYPRRHSTTVPRYQTRSPTSHLGPLSSGLPYLSRKQGSKERRKMCSGYLEVSALTLVLGARFHRHDFSDPIFVLSGPGHEHHHPALQSDQSRPANVSFPVRYAVVCRTKRQDRDIFNHSVSLVRFVPFPPRVTRHRISPLLPSSLLFGRFPSKLMGFLFFFAVSR